MVHIAQVHVFPIIANNYYLFNIYLLLIIYYLLLVY